MRPLAGVFCVLWLSAPAAFARPPVPGPRTPLRRRPVPASEARPRREAPSWDRIVTLQAPGADRILVRGGTFMMGSSDSEIELAVGLCQREPAPDDCVDQLFSNEGAEHEVLLSDFWIDRTEVTVARYRQCVAAGRCTQPPYASGGERFDRADLPVTLVTWQDASTFCEWAAGRLPTEAEWERAARGRAGRRYPWGNVFNPNLANRGHGAGIQIQLQQGALASFAWDELEAGDRFRELAPVGSYPDGRTPDGIDDLAGNVEEWVADYYAPEYPKADQNNPRGPDVGEERVLRGGSYQYAAPWLRGASRTKDFPSIRRSWRGFRCVF